MPTLFFMRHAESEANRNRTLASQTDVSLTPNGMQAAYDLAREFLRNFSIDYIIVSPQLRACQTANPFEKMSGIKAEIDKTISEQHFGRFTGMSYDAVKMDSSYEKDVTKRWEWIPEGGGESYKMLAARIAPFFKRFENPDDHSNYFIVTHAVTLRIIKALLEDTLPVYPEKIANNGEIWQVEFSGLGYKHEVTSLFYGNSASMVHNP
ncbi:MAG: histidine phosphatase family protein [Spirochaetota bacterium]|nr:histidine phosphatase family protein [Spirochaetota bacterium]